MRTCVTLHMAHSGAFRSAPEPIQVEARWEIAHCFCLSTADNRHSAAETSKANLFTIFLTYVGSGHAARPRPFFADQKTGSQHS